MSSKNKIKYEPDNLPLMTRFKLRVLQLARSSYIRPDGTINRRATKLVDMKTSAPATKLIKNVEVSTSDITVDPSRNVWFRLFVPNKESDPSLLQDELPFIYYIHGGGFTMYGPNTKTFDDLCSHLAAEVPAVVASLNYRLAPEHKFPSQYDDSFDALKFIDTKNYDFLPKNATLKKCFIMGDSAGGNIAHHVTFKFCQTKEEFEKIKVVGLLEVMPFYGGEERTESEIRLGHKAPILKVEYTDWMWRSFLPKGADRNHHPSGHVFGCKKNSAEMKEVEFPRTWVIVGEFDILQDWQKRYVEWLKNCGKEVEMIEYPNVFHGFYAFPELTGFKLLIKEVKNIVGKQVTS